MKLFYVTMVGRNELGRIEVIDGNKLKVISDARNGRDTTYAVHNGKEWLGHTYYGGRLFTDWNSADLYRRGYHKTASKGRWVPEKKAKIGNLPIYNLDYLLPNG